MKTIYSSKFKVLCTVFLMLTFLGVEDVNGCTLNNNGSTVAIITPRSLDIDSSDTNVDGVPDSITVVQPTCGNTNGQITLDTGGFTITGGSAGTTGDYSNLTFSWLSSNVLLLTHKILQIYHLEIIP